MSTISYNAMSSLGRLAVPDHFMPDDLDVLKSVDGDILTSRFDGDQVLSDRSASLEELYASRNLLSTELGRIYFMPKESGLALTSGDTTGIGNDTTAASDLELAPELEKLEKLAGQLEAATDELKAGHDGEALSDFEAAAGKVARAAEEVRENPTVENAIEAFETAADELRNAAHALEGEISDEQYQSIVAAVDTFETATDGMLAADDGEADMAGAVANTSEALSSLLDTTGNNPMAELAGLEQVADNFKSFSNDLSENLDSPQLANFEAATGKLDTAADQLLQNSSDQDTINAFETAANELKGVTRALEGQIPDDIFERVTSAVDEIFPSSSGLGNNTIANSSSASTLGTDGGLFNVSDLNIQSAGLFSLNSRVGSVDLGVNNTSTTGPSLELTGHDVFGLGPVHTAIKYTDEAGNVETLSAGPEFGINGSNLGFLNGEENRDGELGNSHISNITPPEGVSVAEYWASLKEINDNYNDQLDYDLFPELFSDEGYNSNSFTFGLIEGTGGTVDADPADYKGASTPIPVVNDKIIEGPSISQNGPENPIVDGAGAVVDTVSSGVTAVGDAIADGASAVVDTVSTGASAVGNAIADGASAVVDTVSTGATAVGNAIADGASAVVDTVSTGTSAVGNAIADGASAVVDTVSSGVNSIGRGISNIGSSISSGISSIGSSISSGISSIGSFIGGFF